MAASQSRYGSWIRSAAIAAGLGLTAVSAAEAQQSRGAAPPPGVEQQVQIPDEDLKTYAEATREVRRIDETYRPRFEAAQSPDERRQIGQEAMSEMVRAVEREGMTVDRYNAISQIAQVDPEVAQQILGYLGQPQ